MTPEIISRNMAGYFLHVNPAPASAREAMFLDPFCGVGNDLISLCKAGGSGHAVAGCDVDFNCLLCASRNLDLYGVEKDRAVLVWCDSTGLMRGLAGGRRLRVGGESRTKEGYRIVRFGKAGDVRGDLVEGGGGSVWAGLGEATAVQEDGNEEGGYRVAGVFLSPPWNNTGYYTNETWKERKFSVKTDIAVGDLDGLELVDLALAAAPSAVVFLPKNCLEEEVQLLASGQGPGQEGGREVELYEHELNGKVKTAAAYVRKKKVPA